MCVWQTQSQGRTCLISLLPNCDQPDDLSLHEYSGVSIAVITHTDLGKQVE